MPDCLCAVILLPVTLPMPIGKYQHQVQRYRPKQAANKWKPEANAAAASAISPEEKDLLHALRAQHGAYPRVQDPRRAHEANIVDRVTEYAGRTEQLLARQEALRNIQRHAHAGEVRVRLTRTSAGVELLITDNGSGFDRSASDWHAGVGLASMQERAKLLGGRCTIRSALGRGTQIAVTLPVGDIDAKTESSVSGRS